jgi:glycine/sarcosine N-methyltransferase
MTRNVHPTVKTSTEFYDVLAPDYNTMTSFEQRLVAEQPLYRVLVERYHIRTALDAGCGTGFHSLLLAQLGVDVTAVDGSKEMIVRLNHMARERNVALHGSVSSFQNLSKTVPSVFDAVFCLGNSLGHLLTKKDLNRTFHEFANVLKPGGVLVLQMLNYERILRRRERIQSVKQADGKTFVRFYDYEKRQLLFHIVTISQQDGMLNHELQSTPLYPWARNELDSGLLNNGFKRIKHFGNIKLEKYNSQTSTDLVVITSKSISLK